MTEKDKMLSGQRYSTADSELLKELFATKELIHDYNLLRPCQMEERKALIKQILGKTGETLLVEQPFYCDYGVNIEVGENFYANFSMTILDEAKVTIGDNAFIGPNVSIYTSCHPLDAESRNARIEWAEPISIGNNVWIGGGVTICPGVTIGNNVVIGAGSVVTKDISDNCVAVGNPCKPIHKI